MSKSNFNYKLTSEDPGFEPFSRSKELNLQSIAANALANYSKQTFSSQKTIIDILNYRAKKDFNKTAYIFHDPHSLKK